MTQSATDKELKALGAQHKNGASKPVTNEVTQLKEKILDKIGAQVAKIDEDRSKLSSHKRKLGPILDKAKKSRDIDELKGLLLDLRELGGEIPATPDEGFKMIVDALWNEGRLKVVDVDGESCVIDTAHPTSSPQSPSQRSRTVRRQATPAAPETPVVPSASVSPGPAATGQAAPATQKSFLSEALERGKRVLQNAAH